MPTTKAGQRAVAKYMKANYDELKVRIPKGRKRDVEARVIEKGESVNGIINALLRAYMGLTDAEWRRKEPDAD